MVIGIILSLALLTYIAYKGYSVILFAPVCAMVAALTDGYHLMPAYTEVFMVRAVIYVKNFFPVFLLGAVFGKVMEDSGAARSVARFIADKLGPERAIVAIVLAAAVLTYGGVSLFVVAFAVYPFANSLFQAADLPRRLIPGTIALGAFTFTMTAIPGTPQIQNIIPTRYFGTDSFAAPGFGICGALGMFVLGVLWLEHRKRKMLAAGERHGEPDTRVSINFNDGVPEIPPAFAAMPLLLVLAINFTLTKMIPQWWDVQILSIAKGLPLAATAIPTANWALIIALVCGIVFAVILAGKQFKARGNLQAALNAGAIGSLLAIMNTASEVGYGNVVSSLSGFASVKDALLSIPGTPLISEALAVNLLAGLTGSASGGMSIALEAMGAHYLALANQIGLSPELLHRVASMSSGGFDTMPHNGAVITLLAICGMNHKKSYPDIGMTSLVLPFAWSFCLIAIWTILGL
ncbi:MAG: GntP family permease [Desulfovibrionaceae bacterium]|nr:GntP family permease [Desulfovibrionaceae bacterium]